MFSKIISEPSIVFLFVLGYALVGQIYRGYRAEEQFITVSSLYWFIVGVLALIAWILYIF